VVEYNFVYILHSKKLNKKYIGLTNDIQRRIRQHKNGKSTFTASAEDWKIIYYEVFASKSDAIREEKFLKSGKGRERIKYLLQNTLQRLK